MNKKEKLYIGIDGGGTKLKIKIQNMKGDCIATGVGGPANISNSFKIAWKNIIKTIDKTLKPLGINIYANDFSINLAIGVAGYEILAARSNFLQENHPFEQIKLYPDSHIACVGAHKGEDGGVIIIGTGSVGLSIINSNISKVGGWGFPYDDLGSGAWIGMQSIATCCQSLDSRQPKSEFTKVIMEKFNNSQTQLLDWATHADSKEFATLAPTVIELAKEHNSHAFKIMTKAGNHISEIGNTLISTNSKYVHNLPLVVMGGIGNHIIPYLDKAIKNHLVQPKSSPEDGALCLLREQETLNESSN